MSPRDLIKVEQEAVDDAEEESKAGDAKQVSFKRLTFCFRLILNSEVTN